MKTRIFHTVNEGLLFVTRGISLLIDGIHDGTDVGHSDMPISLQEDVEECKGMFSDVDCLLYTHLHVDHFSEEKVNRYIKKKNVAIYAPDFKKSNLVFSKLSSDVGFCFYHHLKIYKINTTHDGERFKKDCHVIYVIEIEDEVFVIGGDAMLKKEEAKIVKQLTAKKITGLFVNAYQVLQERETEFVRQLSCEHIWLYHLPFPEDDVTNMKYIKKAALKAYPADLPDVMEIKHMSWIENNI